MVEDIFLFYFAQLCVLTNFYPNLPIILQGYIRHFHDISHLCFSKGALILSFSEVTLTSHRRCLTSTSGGARVPFTASPNLISTHFHPISSGSALKWHNITKGLAAEISLPSILIVWPSKETLKSYLRNEVFSFKALSCHTVAIMEYGARSFQYHCTWPFITDMMSGIVCYEGSCWMILEDTGPILRYGLHHSAEQLWTGRGYNTRTPLNRNANQCTSSADINTINRSPNQRSRKNYFENIVCESFNC